MFLAAALEPLAMPSMAATHAGANEIRPGTILIVAAARSSRHGEAAERIVDELGRVLCPSQTVRVVRFDAEPTFQNERTIQGANPDLMIVRPYTPLKEAIEMGLRELVTIPGRRDMIVVAHDQAYPSSVSTDSLWELARQWEIHVYTIHLATGDNETRVRRLGRRLRNGISGAFKRGPDQQGNSAHDTRRFLHFMADATGAKACVANDENTGTAAAHAIADEILSGPDRERLSNSESQCVSWGADLSQ
jgi:hypothetical protein